MTNIRIIPCLDVSKGRVVKGTNFIDLKDAGDPVELAAKYDEEGADELVFLDITASSDERNTVYELVRRCAEKVFIPFTIGGGIRTVEDARKLLREGAEKISINTAAVQRPELIAEIASEFGNQCVVLAIDARESQTDAIVNGYEVFIHGGRTPTGMDVIDWAKEGENLGAGEILLTSMDRDGTKDGFDCKLTSTVAATVNIPIIASGGVGKLEHFKEGVADGHADALLAASVFHYGQMTISEVKNYLQDQAISVRPTT
ncbi:MAG: imidazole glycerol phosphate synthase subunit HisF [Actinomycetota bacterium]